MSSRIPKIIWMIWLDFDRKQDGDINEDIIYFRDRIFSLHDKSWTINAITKWQELINIVKDEPTVMKVLNNLSVDGAKKSDLLRFYLLKRYGGFWLDISTFLFCSLDVYLRTPGASFIGMYTPSFLIAEILYGSLNSLQDEVQYSTLLDKFVKHEQDKYIKLNSDYSEFSFIPESFFLATEPEHPVISDIYEQQNVFWENHVDKVSSKKTLCIEVNYLMHGLVKQVFEVHDLDFAIIEAFQESDFLKPDSSAEVSFIHGLYRKLYNCSYIFCYLQMYIALVQFIKNNNGTYKLVPVTAIQLPKELQSIDLCYDDNKVFKPDCQAVVVTFSGMDDVLYLHPLSLSRTIKWADTVDKRLTFNDTYIHKVLKSVTTREAAQEALDKLVASGIFQIRFSSWTRKSNIILSILKDLLPNLTRHGRNLKHKKVKRVS